MHLEEEVRLVQEVGLVNMVEEVHLVHLVEEVGLLINTDDNDKGQLTSLVAADTVGAPGKPENTHFTIHC